MMIIGGIAGVLTLGALAAVMVAILTGGLGNLNGYVSKSDEEEDENKSE